MTIRKKLFFVLFSGELFLTSITFAQRTSPLSASKMCPVTTREISRDGLSAADLMTSKCSAMVSILSFPIRDNFGEVTVRRTTFKQRRHASPATLLRTKKTKRASLFAGGYGLPWFNRELKHATFFSDGRQPEVSVFLLKLSWHYHIYIAKYLFTFGDD